MGKLQQRWGERGWRGAAGGGWAGHPARLVALQRRLGCSLPQLQDSLLEDQKSLKIWHDFQHAGSKKEDIYLFQCVHWHGHSSRKQEKRAPGSGMPAPETPPAHCWGRAEPSSTASTCRRVGQPSKGRGTLPAGSEHHLH